MAEIQQLGRSRVETVERPSYYIPLDETPNLYSAFEDEFLKRRDPQAWDLFWKRLEGRDPAKAQAVLADLAQQDAKVSEQIAKMQGDKWKYDSDIAGHRANVFHSQVTWDVGRMQAQSTVAAAQLGLDAKREADKQLSPKNAEIIDEWDRRVTMNSVIAETDPAMANAQLNEDKKWLAQQAITFATPGEQQAFNAAFDGANNAATMRLANVAKSNPNGVPSADQQLFAANLPYLSNGEAYQPRDRGVSGTMPAAPDLGAGSFSIERSTSGGTRTGAGAGAGYKTNLPGTGGAQGAPTVPLSGGSAGSGGGTPEAPDLGSSPDPTSALQALLDSQAFIRQQAADVKASIATNPYGEFGTPVYQAAHAVRHRTGDRVTRPLVEEPDEDFIERERASAEKNEQRRALDATPINLDDEEDADAARMASEMTPGPKRAVVTGATEPPITEPRKVTAAKTTAKAKAEPKEQTLDDILGPDDPAPKAPAERVDGPLTDEQKSAFSGAFAPRKDAGAPRQREAAPKRDDAEDLAGEMTPKPKRKPPPQGGDADMADMESLYDPSLRKSRRTVTLY